MGIRQLAKNGIKWNSFAKISNDLISILQLAIVARFLEKEDFGAMSIVHLVIGFTVLFRDLGMYAAIMHKQNISEDQYNSLYWMNWILHISIFLIIVFISYPVSLFYSDSRLALLIVLASVPILFAPFGKLFVTIKQKNCEFSFLSKVGVSFNFVTFLLTVLMAYLGCGVYSLIFPSYAAAIGSAIIYSLEGRKYFKVSFHFNLTEIKDFFKIGLYDTAAQVMDYFSYKIDVILIGRLFGMDVLGVYNIGKEMAMKVMKVLNPLISSVSVPILSMIQNNSDKLKESYLKILNLVGSINFPVLFCLAVFADPVVELFFSEKYIEAASFIKILCFWGMFASIGNPSGNLVIAKGRTDLSFRWTVVRFFTAPVFIYCASFFTVEAVAYSQVLFQFIFFFIYWRILIYPLSEISLKEYIGSFFGALICSVIAIIPAYFFHNMFMQNSMLGNLIVGCSIFSVIYISLTFVFNKRIVSLFMSLLKK